MENYADTLKTLLRQEEALQFESFSNDAALAIGLRLVEAARAKEKSVAVNITRNGEMIFFHGMNGTSSGNADWIRRKNNLVNRTGHSSFYMHNDALHRGQDPDAHPTLDLRDFAAHGGAFPLILKNSGPIGTITVSGLPGAEDHALVVEVLKEYLKISGDF